jgi:hypothetical protein
LAHFLIAVVFDYKKYLMVASNLKKNIDFYKYLICKQFVPNIKKNWFLEVE